MNKWKKIGIILLILLAAVLAMVIYFKVTSARETSILSETIEEKVSKIVELSTVKYNYTNVAAYKDRKKINGTNLPFTEKGFLIKYNGYIKAGVDLKNIEVSLKDKETVEVTLPRPVILDNVIDEDDIYIYDEKDTVFNNLSINDLYDVLKEEKQKTETEVIDKGLLNEAQKNANEILLTFLENMGFKNIKVTFK
jgi:hypothetical protein